jgi:hypothetical protein
MLSGVIDVFVFRYTRDGLLLFPQEPRDNSIQLQNLPVHGGPQTPNVPDQNDDLGTPDVPESTTAARPLFSRRRWAVGEYSSVKTPLVMFSRPL